MRTDQEIIDKVQELAREGFSFLGVVCTDLVCRLPYHHAKSFLVAIVGEQKYAVYPRDEDTVKGEMLQYMEFAWGNANEHRGLAVNHSLSHMSAWLWLLGYDTASEQVLVYDQYGKPWLRAICEAFGWDWQQWDDGYWRNGDSDKSSTPPAEVTPLDLSK